VQDALRSVAGAVRENVVLRGSVAFSSPGYIATYVHNALKGDSGAMASAVALESESLDFSENVPEAVVELGKHLAMQVRQRRQI
jgi:hypothetical protein